MTLPILASQSPHVIISPRHSRNVTIVVSGFANHVTNSPNNPLTKCLPFKNLVSTGFAQIVELTLDHLNIRYSLKLLPNLSHELPSHITIIPCTCSPHISTTHLFHIFTSHPTTQFIIPNHTPVTHNSPTVPTIHTIPTRLSPVTTKRSNPLLP